MCRNEIISCQNVNLMRAHEEYVHSQKVTNAHAQNKIKYLL